MAVQAYLKKLWYRPIACQSAVLWHPVIVTVNMLTSNACPAGAG